MGHRWRNSESKSATGKRSSNHPKGTFDYVNREKYEFGDYGYGKNNIKLLHVHRHESKHTIREFEVDVHLKLSTQKDYIDGDNKDIIATDSQKNTVYIIAKRHGIKTPEEFGINLCSHFLYMYKHVGEVEITIEEYPWERYRKDNEDHHHAFLYSPAATRFAVISQTRNESPIIQAGLKGLRVLKTTQSAFTDFIQDDYRTLPDVNDRIFSTVVYATWEYSTANGVNFDAVWLQVKDCIIEKFAGHTKTGIFSPSVQNTLYLMEKRILDNVPQISRINMSMPNKHYFEVDLSKFPSHVLDSTANKEVYLPVDKPSGIIYAELLRKDVVSKL